MLAKIEASRRLIIIKKIVLILLLIRLYKYKPFIESI